MPTIQDIFLNTNTNDIQINENGKLMLSIDTRTIQQRLYIYFKTQLGDFFYDSEKGFPWSQLISSPYTREQIITILMTAISEVQGVQKILDLDYSIDSKRIMKVKATIQDVFGKLIKISG